ncbi:MAG: hypothetical protein R8G66_16135 [Cytophagales bacterium]|nr:hypothetical protein [Cytophagales bacterium]
MTNQAMTFILLLMSTVVFAQEPKVMVPGTRVSIPTPEGFTKSEQFSGYQKGETAMINVMDLNGGNYYSNAANFSRENFEAKGVEVLEYKELEIGNYPAKMIKVIAADDSHMINAVFGDSTFSVMIMGAYLPEDKSAEATIKQSILQAEYNKDFELDPFASAFFSIDESNTKLKFAHSGAGMFIYTVDGKENNEKDQPMALVLPLPKDMFTTAQSMAEAMVTGLKQKGLTDVAYVNESDEAINGYDAYEIWATGSMGDAKTSILVHAIVKEENILIIQGIQTAGEFDPEVIRELSSNVTMK